MKPLGIISWVGALAEKKTGLSFPLCRYKKGGYFFHDVMRIFSW